MITDPLKKFKEAMRARKCTFRLVTVSEPEVLKVIMNLKNSTASGVDYLDTKTVKIASELISPALTHIMERLLVLAVNVRSYTFFLLPDPNKGKDKTLDLET